MNVPDHCLRTRLPRLGRFLSLSPWIASLGLIAICAAGGLAQESQPATLRLGGMRPTGVRTSVTESRGMLDFNVTNQTDIDRLGRVLFFYEGQPDIQYGRDVWVPAHSELSTWMLAGPPGGSHGPGSCEIQVLIYDRTGGKDQLLLPSTQDERIRSRGIAYRRREPSTAILKERAPLPEAMSGQLPKHDSLAEEAYTFALAFRHARDLTESLFILNTRKLPPNPEAMDGIDHFILADNSIANDPVGLRALRQWLQQGGTLWVMLDLVKPELIAPLLGDSMDYQIVDQVSLTTFTIDKPLGRRKPTRDKAVPQQHERPVNFVRVLLPSEEPLRDTINGWPVWFTRKAGRGTVVFTTLGPRGWFHPRTPTDQPSRYSNFPDLPVPSEMLIELAGVLQPLPEDDPYRPENLEPLLTEEIGYTVMSRGTIMVLFGVFMVAAVAAMFFLRKSHRLELLGWIGPVAALGATAAFVLLGDASRRGAAPTVAVAQVVSAVNGKEEAAVHGVLAMYRPDSGLATAGVSRGGYFQLDASGLEGQTRRHIQTDQDAWHWENLELPAGVRLAPFRSTVSTGKPLSAIAAFDADGLKGKLRAGPFEEISDAILSTPSGRTLAVHIAPDGSFRTGADDVLPLGEFLANNVLTDQQQKRRGLYRLIDSQRRAGDHPDAGNVLFAWAKPVDMGFTLAPDARTVGNALLELPLQLERSAPGQHVTIPAPLIPYRRILDQASVQPPRQTDIAVDMELRFQLPPVVLPFKIERARLTARINAPGREVKVSAKSESGAVELYRKESPLDLIRIDVADEGLLHLDAEGGLHWNLKIGRSPPQQADQGNGEKWVMEYLELEVAGQTAP